MLLLEVLLHQTFSTTKDICLSFWEFDSYKGCVLPSYFGLYIRGGGILPIVRGVTMKTLTIEKFFRPSSELTTRITNRMRDRSLEDLQHALGSELERDNSSSQDPWIDLLATENHDNSTSAQELEEDQKWISEILYGYLARLANSRLLAENQSYDAVEAISAGMASRLGLKDSSADLELLHGLAEEFQHWLSERAGMTFVAGWGTVWTDPANESRFGLEKFSPEVGIPAKARSAKAGSRDLAGRALAARTGSGARNWLASFFSTSRKATK
jgi:hypothetical protein